MRENALPDAELRKLVDAVIAADAATVSRLLAASPDLARARFQEGATRGNSQEFYLEQLGRYVLEDDSALHIAATAYNKEICQILITAGAEIHASNRHGAQPLHSAAAGQPGSGRWNPVAQSATIDVLVVAGADPNAADKRGVTPLHIAVRTRCASAVQTLLNCGADPARLNKNGSSPVLLASLTTGRGGSGSPEAKAQQQEILQLFEQYAAKVLS
ncbi:MAG: ankyrin repeat domain-containing protein [Terriglobia bacterium]